MTRAPFKFMLALALVPALLIAAPVQAHKLHQGGVAVPVASSALTVTPSRDWNQLSGRIGKNAETWTLDGVQLNDLTFYGGIPADKPLLKERNKKREPLPKFTAETLLIEVPELLERTYRTYKDLATFHLVTTEPTLFLGAGGVSFSYEFTDKDELTRKGEARAAIIEGKLYMITFDAPRLSYFARNTTDFHALIDSARLK